MYVGGDWLFYLLIKLYIKPMTLKITKINRFLSTYLLIQEILAHTFSTSSLLYSMQVSLNSWRLHGSYISWAMLRESILKQLQSQAVIILFSTSEKKRRTVYLVPKNIIQHLREMIPSVFEQCIWTTVKRGGAYQGAPASKDFFC